MKKIGVIGLIVLMIVMTVGCSTPVSKTTTKTATATPSPTPIIYLSAPQIVKKLKEAGLPIVYEITYDEKTDPNNLLGRPGEYTAKTNFIDKRYAKDYEDSKKYLGDDFDESFRTDHGMLETFANKADMQKRLDYLSVVNEVGGIVGNYYMYHSDRAILRIDYTLTPKEAAEYEKAFNKIMGIEPKAAPTVSPKV
jgi:hypothetical protein